MRHPSLPSVTENDVLYEPGNRENHFLQVFFQVLISQGRVQGNQP